MILDEFTPLCVDKPSAWLGHIPFGIWLGRTLAPSLFVELGVHHGHSFFNISKGVLSSNPSACCIAVDAWEGDAHAGEYGPDIFEGVHKCNQREFQGRCQLLKTTFDQALTTMEDGSIELLHIDGLHTYEAVKSDFETWLPKMAANGVVLFHDISELKEDFGVWKFWRELKQTYPVTYEFSHDSGLGVLCLNQDTADPLPLLQGSTPESRTFLDSLRSQGATVRANCLIEINREYYEKVGAEQAKTAAELEARLDEAEKALRQEKTTLRALRSEHALKLKKVTAGKAQSTHPLQHLSKRVEELENVCNLFVEYFSHIISGEPNQSGIRWSRFLSRHPGLSRLLLRKKILTYALRNRRWSIYPSYFALEKSGLFDSVFYLKTYPDVLFLASDPLIHWVISGCDEGRKPHPNFDPVWYLDTYVDVRDSGVNPFLHYLHTGAQEGRKPSASASHLYVEKRSDQGERPYMLSSYLRLGSAEASFAPPASYREISVKTDSFLAQKETRNTSDKSIGSGKKLKVVLITGEATSPGHQYRVLQLASSLERLHHEVRIFDMDEAVGAILAPISFDVLWVWRVPCSSDYQQVIAEARHQNATVIYDLDDLITEPDIANAETIDGIRSMGFSVEEIRNIYGRYRDGVRLADACSCSTTTLEKALGQFMMPMFLIPNGYTTAYKRQAYLARRERMVEPKAHCVRIGYASGSLTHQRDFQKVVSACVRILEKYPQTLLVTFAKMDAEGVTLPMLDLNEYPELEKFSHRIEIRNFVPFENMPNELARFDINLAPLEVGNVFCEAKSELKYFEAALVKVPTIASPTVPFSQAIASGQNGYLANTEEEWFTAMDALIGDEDLRRKIGSAAYHSCLWTYGPDWKIEIVEQVIHSNPGLSLEVNYNRKPFRLPSSPVVTEIKIPDHRVVYESSPQGVAEVTVIIPLHNYRNYVIEAMDSVREQTLQDLDLIVIDDQSTDDSVVAVREWMEENQYRFRKITLIQNVQNSGLALSRNAGFSLAETDFVFPLDADNKLLPACLEKCFHTLEGTSASMCYPMLQHFGSSSRKMGEALWNPSLLANGNYIDAMALLKKSAWARVDGYRSMFGWEDYDMWCSFVEKGMWGIQVPEVLGLYRVHADSMLATHTMKDEVYSELSATFQKHHPWVRL